ncbi:MAG: S-methyl-5-thioribose-1-phosphate isomerase [Magnetococcales bacterium]|nr:S-methyl-5-thioribose-1-phosphate isomerase [Magnetococcales bacterium]
MSGFETITWHNGHVRMLEQRDLPWKVRYVDYDSAEAVAGAITDMVIRGAPAIGCAAAFGVAVEAFRIRNQQGVPNDWARAMAPGMDILARSRPTAVNLFWALAEMKPLLDTMPKESLPERLLEKARQIHADDVASCKAMGRLGAAILPDTGDRPINIMTHCNAGALATAGYGTALGVIRGAHESGRTVHVIANETRPYLQGARLTAWELLQDNINTTLITDNMAGYLMSKGEVDAIVVGADRVAANGDVANKIGTYTHAVLAKRHNIPFLVAAPVSTVDPNMVSGDGIEIEKRQISEEVTHILGKRIAAKGVNVNYPAFDITPAALITALVTEKQVILNPNTAKIKALFTG